MYIFRLLRSRTLHFTAKVYRRKPTRALCGIETRNIPWFGYNLGDWDGPDISEVDSTEFARPCKKCALAAGAIPVIEKFLVVIPNRNIGNPGSGYVQAYVAGVPVEERVSDEDLEVWRQHVARGVFQSDLQPIEKITGFRLPDKRIR